MNISEAISQRRSIREFLKTPVSNSLIKQLLEKASRSPSGGNLQPWKIFIVNNKTMKDFLAFQEAWDDPEAPAYDIYPSNLKEPYRTYRYELGEQMYSLLGIPRDDPQLVEKLFVEHGITQDEIDYSERVAHFGPTIMNVERLRRALRLNLTTVAAIKAKDWNYNPSDPPSKIVKRH